MCAQGLTVAMDINADIHLGAFCRSDGFAILFFLVILSVSIQYNPFANRSQKKSEGAAFLLLRSISVSVITSLCFF